MIFNDRTGAGQQLAQQLQSYRGRSDVLVLGIPRGGVPVAYEVATALSAPLDVFISRKLGVPGQEELAFGAISSGGVRVMEAETVEAMGISELEIELIAAQESQELERRERIFRQQRSPLDVSGRTVILVDDGIATGSSMLAAIRGLRQMKPARLVVAVPVAPASTCARLRTEVDDLVCLHSPRLFHALGQFYEDFLQVDDQTVRDLLARATPPATGVGTSPPALP